MASSTKPIEPLDPQTFCAGPRSRARNRTRYRAAVPSRHGNSSSMRMVSVSVPTSSASQTTVNWAAPNLPIEDNDQHRGMRF